MRYAFLFIVAAVLAAALTPLVRMLAVRVGVMDRPGLRKIHTVPVPRLGGVGVVAAGVLTIIIERFVAGRAINLEAWLPMLIGGGLVFAVGVADDVRPVSVPVKLAVQVVAAAVAIAFGIRIDHVTVMGTTWPLGWLAVPVTLLWIVGLTNAFNLMDGLDGLAAGLAIIASATCAAILITRGDVQGGMLLVILLGATCGFLPYNFNPATIFLGDSGSLVVGHLLAVTAITGWQKGATALAVAVPLLIFALPIVETTLSTLRRARYHGVRAVFAADQQHMHYRLVGLGLSHRRAVLLLYGVSLALSLLALATMQIP